MSPRPVLDPKRNKFKYSCPTCAINVWGRPNLAIQCRECREPLAVQLLDTVEDAVTNEPEEAEQAAEQAPAVDPAPAPAAPAPVDPDRIRVARELELMVLLEQATRHVIDMLYNNQVPPPALVRRMQHTCNVLDCVRVGMAEDAWETQPVNGKLLRG